MSKFYSTIQGCAGEATRRGTGNSGIRASVQSYEGSIITRLEEVNGETILSIDTATDSRSTFGDRKFRGTITEFNEAMQLLKDIKEKKVSVTRHRAKSNTQLQIDKLQASCGM